MFNSNKSENENTSNNEKVKSDFLNFSAKSRNDVLMENLAEYNEFVKNDLMMRAVVTDMIEQELGENIEKIKNIEFLVDSVVNRLKAKQLELEPYIKEQ